MLLHRGDPYLQLGPLKYETLNEVPHVGTFRGFASDNIMNKMMAQAKGNLMSTPYATESADGQSFSKLRTSKVQVQTQVVVSLFSHIVNLHWVGFN